MKFNMRQRCEGVIGLHKGRRDLPCERRMPLASNRSFPIDDKSPGTKREHWLVRLLCQECVKGVGLYYVCQEKRKRLRTHFMSNDLLSRLAQQGGCCREARSVCWKETEPTLLLRSLLPETLNDE